MLTNKRETMFKDAGSFKKAQKKRRINHKDGSASVQNSAQTFCLHQVVKKMNLIKDKKGEMQAPVLQQPTADIHLN